MSVASVDQGEGSASGTDIHRLPQAIQNQNLSIEQRLHVYHHATACYGPILQKPADVITHFFRCQRAACPIRNLKGEWDLREGRLVARALNGVSHGKPNA